MTWILGRSNGLHLQSNTACMCAYADSLGLDHEVCMIFKVISAWDNSLYQICMEKLGYVDHNPATKWVLKICIAWSALFFRCIPVGMS